MLAIRAARLFDGRSVTLDPVVLVDAGRIAAVTDSAPAGSEILDLGAATLMPGLVDAHTHLALDASDDPIGRVVAASDDELLDHMRAAARTALAAGVTTVRDLGDRGYLSLVLREELARDPMAGPRVLAAGPPITTTGGHCWFLGGEADGVEGIRAAVRERAEHGVDVIKIMATGGELTPGSRADTPQYGLDELRAAVDEAHRHGLPVTAHAHAAGTIVDAVAAGVDMIEHCSYATDEVIDALRMAGTVVSVTVGADPGVPYPPRLITLLVEYFQMVTRLRTAGVPVVCGSDAGIREAKPHGVLPYGVAALVERAGFSPAEALRSATSLAAEACGLGDSKGVVAPGYDADLLAVNGNPLIDIAALTRVRAVLRAGTLVS
ncbi:metal-dependent hydrolase family protein [Micromonospora sp. CPCC 206061]|uniref:metal-dependent hydrolase family protein n=1 Tax=Micromonospora sp. CPCC 206061 TaxID=3122410 RepID=UPI002FF1647D